MYLMDNSLEKLLKLLSITNINLEEEKENIIHLFSEIYKEEDYRHKYSEIFKIIKDIDSSREQENKNILNIIEHLNYIQNHFKLENYTLKISKLEDHINLEYARMEYLKSDIDKIYNDIKKIKYDTITIKKETKAINDSSKKQEENIENTKKNIEHIDEKIQNTKENIEDIDRKIKNTEENINVIDKKIKDTEENIKNSKYDIVTIISIMFSIFTLLGVNASIISGLFSLTSSDRVITVSFWELLVLFCVSNIIVFGGIYFIFSILRKQLNN